MDSKIIYLATEWGDWLCSGCLRLPMEERFGAHRAPLSSQTILL
jgi:hypothetical protein